MKNILDFIIKWIVKLGKIILRRIAKLIDHLCSINYKDVVLRAEISIGNFVHKILFNHLLPKRFHNLTKDEIYTIIFKSDTPAGKKFDIWLLVLITLNLIVLIIDSFSFIRDGSLPIRIIMTVIEWCFTIIFTFEYYLRIYCRTKPWKYIISFYGIIDFISIFPAYLSLLLPVTQSFTVFRMLRMLRIFRILNMRNFIEEGYKLINALKRSAVKIVIFMMFVFIAAVILGTIVYAVEYEDNPAISSIPRGIYWAVVTLTTVGYGDIAPVTPLGQFISMIVMILGYSIIAVPTGIVAGETIEESRRERERRQRKEAARKEEAARNELENRNAHHESTNNR